MVIVIMGVAGAGKTTVGRLLAAELGWAFVDADDVHSAENVERMSRGVPLTDRQRTEWLTALASIIDEHARTRTPLVLACSALRRSYRAALLALTDHPEEVRLVLLHTDRDRLAERLLLRTGHFFPAHLLDTQLQTLELPRAGEDVLVLEASSSPDELVAAIRRAFAV